MNRNEYEMSLKILNEWTKAYYEEDNPIATDEEYDVLLSKVKKYVNNNNIKISNDHILNRVGGKQKKGFSKHKHMERMWSMEDIFTKEELISWIDKVDSSAYYIMPKYDGMSINLLYQNGKLIKGVSRGDGVIGEDITNNVMVIDSIPKEIPYKETIEIRGELFITKNDFERINLERMALGENLFANSRNAVAGTMRQLNSSIVKNRNVKFLPWGIGYNALSHFFITDDMKFLIKQGFDNPPYEKICSDAECVLKAYGELLSKRNNLSMAIDGMVVNVVTKQLQEQLGYTAKYPKWRVAFKFPAVEKSTKIVGVVEQVGRTGVITPVALLEPIWLDGSEVTRVTLNNYEEIKRKDIRIGDTVAVIKSGDIIPKITSVFKDRRTGILEKEIHSPKVCPSCQQATKKDETYVRCINRHCPTRILNILLKYVDRDGANIGGIGGSILEQLISRGLVKSIIDIYKLTKKDLTELDLVGEKKASYIIDNINKSKGLPLNKFLIGLSIGGIGKAHATTISERFGLDIFNVSEEDLVKVNGIGDKVAKAFTEEVKQQKDMLDKLIKIVNPIAQIKKNT